MHDGLGIGDDATTMLFADQKDCEVQGSQPAEIASFLASITTVADVHKCGAVINYYAGLAYDAATKPNTWVCDTS